MERVDRLKTAYSYLMSKGIAHKQQDVVNKMKKPKSSVSSAFNGDPRYLTKGFVNDFIKTYDGIFSFDWIWDGIGDMIVSDKVVKNNNENNSNIGTGTQTNNGGNTYGDKTGNVTNNYYGCDDDTAIQLPDNVETRPHIPYTAAGGVLTEVLDGISESSCERRPKINVLPDYDFTITVKGDSMEPKYEGGDDIACKRIYNTSFIQWGKTHVLNTSQGIVVKRIYDDGDRIKCVSYNTEAYPAFSIDKREIYSISLVVGLIRM